MATPPVAASSTVAPDLRSGIEQPRPGTSRSLAGYLFALVAISLVPLLAFALVQASLAANKQKEAIKNGLLEEARALAVAVQTQVVTSVSALTSLAASTDLDRGDIPGFYEEASRTRSEQPWDSVWLGEPDGRQVLSLTQPLGDPLPPLAQRDYFNEALTTRRTVISGTMSASNPGHSASGYHIAIAAPVIRDGDVKYVLAAGFRPDRLAEILGIPVRDSQRGVAAVLDRNFIVLARTRDAAKRVGSKASNAFIAAVGDAREGLVRTRTLEGDPVYSAFVRIPDTGWIVSVALRSEEVDAPFQHAMLLTVLFGLALLLAGGGLAFVLARRITRPISQLVFAARDIGSGKAVDVVVDRPVVEIAALAEALQAASEGTRERERLARTFAVRLQDDIDAERRRIARSFHDDLGQRLSVIAMMADIMRNSAADQEQAKLLDSVCDGVRGAIRSMRAIIADIRPTELDLGLGRALGALLDEWSARSGVAHELDISGRYDDLPEPTQVALYRIAQEGVNNVSKHASASSVHVTLRRTSTHVVLEVCDDGKGIDVEAANNKKGHFGLFGMRERAAQLKGTLDVSGKPGAGTKLKLRFPCAPDDADIAVRA